MTVTLLLFAHYRDLTGASELKLDLPEGTTAAGLVERLRRQGGAMGRLPSDPVLAVNQEYATLDVVLRDGDEVALLPPVAGG